MTDPADTVDFARFDLGAIRPKLRADVTLRSDRFGGEDCVVIEDAVRGRFFRVGPAEAVFLSLLDGRTSVSEAVAETASVVEEEALTELQAGAFCRWLVENELATTPQSLSVNRVLAAAEDDRRRVRRERLNPVMVKTPLGCPDGIFARIAGVLGWLFGPIGAAVWLIAVGWAAVVAWTNVERLFATLPTVSLHDVPIFLLTAGVLKLLHEAGHGVACRRLGCEVRECGVLWLLFIPLPYVDVTGSWRLASKWDRSLIAAAGMLVELFIAALAVLVWDASGSPVVRHHALNVAITAGVVTILFNANPLMRFDGYYILADLLELPNLASHGQVAWRSAARGLFFGQQAVAPTWPEGRGWVVRMYGAAAFVWRVVICVSLTLAADALYDGAGVILAAAAVFSWVVLPATRMMNGLFRPDPVNPINRWRFAGVSAVLGAFVYLGLTQVRHTSRVRLPAVVEHAPVTEARAATAGFIDAVHVSAGQRVRGGDRLLTLRNDRLVAEARMTELSLEQSLLAETGYHRRGEPAAAAVERENAAALRVRLEDLRDRVDRLIVRAPADGRILTPRPDELTGRWAAAGTPLLELGPQDGPAVRFYVPQRIAAKVSAARDRPVRLRLWGGIDPIEASVTDIAPRAVREIPSRQLTAAAGGPLQFVQAADTETGWRLVQPHFAGRLDVPPGSLSGIGVGQTGLVEIEVRSRTLGESLATALSRRLDERNARR